MVRLVQSRSGMRSLIAKTVVLASLGALALACGSEGRKPARVPEESTTRTTSAALSTNATLAPVATPAPPQRPLVVETASAVMRVTTARCDREVECRNVGIGREFGDRDECVNAIGHHVVAAIPSDACPAGVEADLLATCVRDVEAEPCSENADAGAAVERLASCTRDRLCASPF